MCRRTVSLGAGLAVIASVFCTSPEARAYVAEGASRAIVTDHGPLKRINTPTESKYLGIPFGTCRKPSLASAAAARPLQKEFSGNPIRKLLPLIAPESRL
jgi:hypothetical protein